MASMPFVASMLDMWAAWNIRGFMILSLSMQLLLATVSPLRRKTSNQLVILMIWSAYLLADWVAIFAFGLITNSKFKNNTTSQEVDVGQDLLALWSAFLLIHLGGPDSITAYALEDNALWLRHLVGLVVQILAFLNIFVKTLPDNKLRVPTILIAIAGSIKYGERTRALYLASVENLKESVLKSRLLDLNGRSMRPEGVAAQSNSDDIHDDQWNIRKAFHHFQIFKGLICDMMPNHSQWLESRDFFIHQDPRTAFEIVKMELRFFYEVFYTKILAAYSARGVLIRSLAFYNVFAALIVFCVLRKDAFHGVDVRITYSLLAGVIALDTASEIMLVGSNWTKLDNTYAGYLTIAHGVVLFFIVGLGMLCMGFVLSALCCCKVATKQWSESTGTLSLLAQGFEESRPRKGSMLQRFGLKINGFKMVDRTFDMELWDFVFIYLSEKSKPADDADKVRAVYEARGEGPLCDENLAYLRHFVDDFEFENSLLIWHCATEICYQVDGSADGMNNKRRKFSEILSDYMSYLLIKQPKLMSPVAGIEEIRYRDTCAEMKSIGKRYASETMEQFCKNILDEHTGTNESDARRGQGMSVLADACNLANLLRQRSAKWDIISEVWVDLLSHAAGHCRVDSHIRLLSEGGEFLTFVWLLMAHFGILPRFPKQ